MGLVLPVQCSRRENEAGMEARGERARGEIGRVSEKVHPAHTNCMQNPRHAFTPIPCSYRSKERRATTMDGSGAGTPINNTGSMPSGGPESTAAAAAAAAVSSPPTAEEEAASSSEGAAVPSSTPGAGTTPPSVPPSAAAAAPAPARVGSSSPSVPTLLSVGGSVGVRGRASNKNENTEATMAGPSGGGQPQYLPPVGVGVGAGATGGLPPPRVPSIARRSASGGSASAGAGVPGAGVNSVALRGGSGSGSIRSSTGSRLAATPGAAAAAAPATAGGAGGRCINPASDINARLDSHVEVRVYPCNNNASSSHQSSKKKFTQFTIKPEGVLIQGANSRHRTSQGPNTDLGAEYARHIGRKLRRYELSDTRACQLLVTTHGGSYYAVPSPEAFSRHSGTCRLLGDRKHPLAPHVLAVGDFLRVGSVGVVVIETHDGTENRILSEDKIKKIIRDTTTSGSGGFLDFGDTDEGTLLVWVA
mmetsp:Transcript_7584/g.15258  ORF Transcript_7584/g.15258 Transcript_7584/m.15258 type:complete len:476 (+) Transcript_7584:870-2297(+)